MLTINNLQAKVAGNTILQGINLTIKPGEVHAIMGPNGSGKSTLANVLSGHEDYEVTGGSVDYFNKDLFELETHERACEGIFLAFQYPVSIPGVSNIHFLKAALNSVRKYQGLDELDAMDFMEYVKTKAAQVQMPDKLMSRSLNEGFSGGEKKRNEILQMLLLEPKFAILDETDSGLDIDALKTVADGVNALRSPERSFLVVTHYQRLLDYIVPDYVHVLAHGKIIKSGGPELAHELEKEGYSWITSANTENGEVA